MDIGRAQIDKECFPEQNIQELTVFDLVYKYLLKCADRDRKWKQKNCACNKFNRQHARRKDLRDRTLATIRTNFGEEIFGDNSERFKLRMNKNVLPKRISRSSSKEYIADYTKAVRDERRRAKSYVREALLYGLQSGLLIPTDRRRNILRVSQELGTFH